MQNRMNTYGRMPVNFVSAGSYLTDSEGKTY